MSARSVHRLRGRFLHLPATLLAGVSAGAALLAAAALDLPLRDPDNAAGPLFVRLPAIVLMLMVLDVLPRAVLRRRGGGRLFASVKEVICERWSAPRMKLVTAGLLCFYLTYVGYRNLKGFLPFVREGTADASLLALDRSLGLGSAPSSILHSLLGTGVAAHLLSIVYVAFLVFVPLSLGIALVWSRRVRSGYLYVTVLCLNWLLGAISYYLLPSLGPVFAQPELFSELPATAVSRLQEMLASDRTIVLDDPHASDRVHGIAGFASLHVAIVFSAVLVAHLMRLGRALRAGLWLFLLLTMVSTIYFGWHYLVDDVAGLCIGALAVWLGARATGYPLPACRWPAWSRQNPTWPAREAGAIDVTPDRPLRWAIAAGGLLLLAVALSWTGEVVARGNLLAVFESYEVTRVRLLGMELFVDRSADAGDALTAGALALVAAVLLLASRRLSAQRRRAFARAGWGALFLAGDDLLSAHETIGHNLLALGRVPLVDHPDDAVLAAYALVAIAFLWHERALLGGVARGPWWIAGAAAALAVAHDVSSLHLRALEEGLEVLAAFAALVGVVALTRHHVGQAGGVRASAVPAPSRAP